MPAPKLDEYGFNPQSGRFRSLTTGRFVPTDDIRTLVNDEIQRGFERLGILSEKVATGQATVQQLQDAVISHLRNSHLSMYALGRGGVMQMSEGDFNQISQFLEGEYSFLENFMADIENGNQTAGQIRTRLNLYGEAIWTSYNAGENNAYQAAGYTEERRIAKDDGGTCRDCERYAALGWQPIGTLPKPGERSQCGRRCRCNFEYRTTTQRGKVTLR